MVELVFVVIIYDLDIKIEEINGQRICVYFDNEYIEAEEIQTLAI